MVTKSSPHKDEHKDEDGNHSPTSYSSSASTTSLHSHAVKEGRCKYVCMHVCIYIFMYKHRFRLYRITCVFVHLNIILFNVYTAKGKIYAEVSTWPLISRSAFTECIVCYAVEKELGTYLYM